jgi:peptide/nickel transport system permease protein
MEAIKRNTQLYSIRERLKREQRNLLFHRFFSNKLAVIGSIITLVLAIVAIFAPVIASYDPYQMVVTDRLKAPGANHLLGTDNFGRDLLSRVVYGAQKSMGVGFAVSVATSLFGLIIGLYAGYYRLLDSVLMRICDGLMAVPGVLLAIAIMAALGPRTENVIICITIVYTPHIARVVRSAALVVREQTYIEAMKAMGAPAWRTIWLHIAPNTLSPLIVQATFIFADAIIIEAALSFLGAGVPAPDPSWGNIVYDGKVVIFQAWWMTVFPALAIIMSVLGLNLFGDGMRDLLDPHTNQARK